jgi:hypothetical protein
MVYDRNEFLREQVAVAQFLQLMANPQLRVVDKVFTTWPPVWNDGSMELPTEDEVRKVTYGLDGQMFEFLYTRKEWLNPHRAFIKALYEKRTKKL